MQNVSENFAKAVASIGSVAFTVGIFAFTAIVMPASEFAAATGTMA